MNERGLIALMASIIYSGAQSTENSITIKEASEIATYILLQVDSDMSTKNDGE